MSYPRNINQWPEIKVYNVDFRQACLDMALTLSKRDMWNIFDENIFDESIPKDTFIFDKRVTALESEPLIEKHGHTGATFGYVLSIAALIHKKGFVQLREEFK